MALASCAGSRFRGTNHEFVQSNKCEAARANGLPVGKKMDMIAALVEKGIQPNAA